MSKKKIKDEKARYYNIEAYSPEELQRMRSSLFMYALSINGLPQNHSEVFQKRGWLLPFLYTYDDLLWGRWDYWFRIIDKGTIEDSGPIPQIEWTALGNGGYEYTRKMLDKTMNHHEANMDNFAHWLEWGLALTKEEPRISASLNEHYYRNFDMFLMQKYPSDYMSHVLSEQTGRGYKQGLGYFPTPFSVSILMTKMVYMDEDPQKHKAKTVNDPCVGCGACFLPASNYSLKGYANDISRIAVSLTKIQCMLYAPWFAFHPAGIKGFDDKDIVRLQPAQDRKAVAGQMELILF